MTILSKKKTIQGKQEVENPENPSHHGGVHSLPLNNISPHNQILDRNHEEILNSPSLIASWPPGPCEDDHHYEEYENMESGPSHGKRRHRTSPLRSSRGSKHWERVNNNSPSHCVPVSTSSSNPGPSSSDSCGYNSSDEYDYSHKAKRTEAQWIEEDRLFEKKMRKRGLLVKKMGEDGACLFRAVADQVYGDQDMHGIVRKHSMDYIALNSDYFSQYVTEDFNTYVNRKRLDCTHGNHIEMQAISEMYNRTIEVFCYGKDPINIFHAMQKSENEPIRLSYQRGSHYNSIVDPHKATIGVGLGLPGFSPGAADTSLLKDAIRQSEDLQIEQAMLEDKLRATDWEATNEAIEEQVARDSYLQYLRDNEKRQKALQREVAPSSSSSENNTPIKEKTEEVLSGAAIPIHMAPSSSYTLIPPNASYNLPPHLLGLTEWEDAGILAQVLAESQQEYLDNLKKRRAGGSSPSTDNSDTDNFSKPSTSR